MKILKNFLLLLTVVVLTAGCKFEAPLTDHPTRKIDPALLGSWFSQSDGKPLEVYRLSNTEYLVIFDGSPYVCTHSDINGTSFISCRQLKNDKEYYGKYAYMGYKMDGKDLLIFGLSDSVLSGLTNEKMAPAQQREVIEKAAKSGTALKDNGLRYRKVSDPDSPSSSKR